jgi:hypothetical protein
MMQRILINIPRYLIIVAATLVFTLTLPFASLAIRLVDGLTDEDVYLEIVHQVDIAAHTTSLLQSATNLIPGLKENAQARLLLDKVNQTMTSSIDDTIAQIVSQIPAYLAGRRDHLTARLILVETRKKATTLLRETVPGGHIFATQIRQGVEATIPEHISLVEPLKALEVTLLPIRAAISGLLVHIRIAKKTAVGGLILIVVCCFFLCSASRWVGIALCGAAILGMMSGALIDGLVSLVLPDIVLTNDIFKNLLSDSIDGFRTTALKWGVLGLSLVVLSFAAPFARTYAARTPCNHAPLFTLVTRSGSSLSLATIITIIPTLGVYLASTIEASGQKAAHAALKGRVVTSAVIDYLLLPLLIAGVGDLIGNIFQFELAGVFAVSPLWLCCIIFWALRDRPRTGGGFNFIDRLAGVYRVRQPGQAAVCASLRRSLPLIGALLASTVAPIPYVFGIVCGIEVGTILIGRQSRSLGDLLGGTRARIMW